ncbi:MAG: TolB family protein, partial [bacterium]
YIFLIIYCSDIKNVGILIFDKNSIYPKCTPDCSKIAFIYRDYFYPNGDVGIDIDEPCDAICYIDYNGNNFSVIDFENNYFANIDSFSFSPDGKYICFSAQIYEHNTSCLYKIPSEGGIPVVLFGNSDSNYIYSPSWSSNGEWIYFVRQSESFNSEIWKIKPDGKELSNTNIKESYIYSIECSKISNYLLIN